MMASKRVAFVLAVTAAVLGVLILWQGRGSDPSTVLAQSQSSHFTMSAATYRFAGYPTELSTTVLLDTQSGKTWYLRVRTATTTDGHTTNSVEWAPMGYAAQ